jgi:hypothetical protein
LNESVNQAAFFVTTTSLMKLSPLVTNWYVVTFRPVRAS